MPVEKFQPDYNIDQDRVEQIKQLFPEAVRDGEIDLETLKSVLGLGNDDDSVEHFSLNWPGKREARKIATVPSQGTLVPVESEGINQNTTENVFIEGDNLEVLKLLQKSYAGKIKMIYIDPPYNTGNDFIYKDDFKETTENYLKNTAQKDEKGNLLTSNPKLGGRFHSNWLNMMYPRLRLAKNLLKEDGVIFISIDDNEIHNLRTLCNEIFGEDNFVGKIIHKNNSSKNQAKLLSIATEYIICFANDYQKLKKNEWKLKKKGVEDIVKIFEKLKEKGLALEEIHQEIKELYKRPKYTHLSRWNKIDEKGIFKDADLSREGGPKDYTIKNPETGTDCVIPKRGWGKSYRELIKLQEENLIWYGDPDTPPGVKDYIQGDDESVPDNFFYYDNSVDTREIRNIFGQLIFENPKPKEMIKHLISMVQLEDNHIVLDFFAGSCTTANAVMELNKEDGGNRKFICIQLPEKTYQNSKAYKAGYETIAEIGKERIRRSIKKIEEEFSEKLELAKKPDLGFKVYKLTHSNFKIWQDYKESDLQQLQMNLLESEDTLVSGWTPEKVVTELQLLEGFSFDSKIAKAPDFTNNKVTLVEHDEIGHKLFICLDKKLDINTIQQVRVLEEDDIFICLDNALTDQEKIMLEDGCNVKTI